MKNTLPVLVLLVSSATAFAQTAPSATSIPEWRYSSYSEKFSKLVDVYESGEKPELSDLTGWYSGRCYNRAASFPTASILVGRVKADLGKDADIFGQKFETMMILADESSSLAVAGDYFDELDASKEKDIETFLKNRTNHYGPILEVEEFINSQVGGLDNEMARPEARWSIRKVGTQLIVRRYQTHSSLNDAPFVEPRDLSWEWTTEAYCIYIKKVK